MNVDIVNILRFQVSVSKCALHHQLGTQTLRMRSSDVMSISAHTFTHHLSIDLSTASLGMLQLLEDKTASTFTHHETIAASAERT